MKFSSRPFGTYAIPDSVPAVNCRAILRGSFGTGRHALRKLLSSVWIDGKSAH